MGTGVSFSLRNFGDAVSTLASLPGLSPKLAQLVRTMNLSAMGVLNFQRHLGVSSNTLSAAFRVMDAALKQQSYTEHMVFLGAVLVNKQSRTDFVNEVYNMEHLTTIILQTHVHGDPELPLNESSKDRCHVLPVSAINAQLQHQDFLSMYLRTYSDGWAMFEVQRDLWKACRTNDYIRLELVALGARYNGSSFAPSHSK
ncbi:uncharacterized protein LOC142813899 [Rhipicephalus microplus]|uniref:uncharacterized protein LOC142813899 n=1 Tax=Rhipicephalus microplus TaxID=6941 RepID=UPI003F6B1CFA